MMSKTEKIIILLDSFARSEAEAALAAYSAAGGNSSRVVIAPITELMAHQKTADAIDAVKQGNWPGGTPRKEGRRSALIAGADKSEAVALMRSFKSVLPGDADPSFALVTETGKDWTVDEYLDHIRKEHDYMKTADPIADSDMKEMT